MISAGGFIFGWGSTQSRTACQANQDVQLTMTGTDYCTSWCAGAPDVNFFGYSSWNIVTEISDGSTFKTDYVNGAFKVTESSTTTNWHARTKTTNIGGYIGANKFGVNFANGPISYLFVFNTAMSSNDRAIMENCPLVCPPGGYYTGTSCSTCPAGLKATCCYAIKPQIFSWIHSSTKPVL